MQTYIPAEAGTALRFELRTLRARDLARDFVVVHPDQQTSTYSPVFGSLFTLPPPSEKVWRTAALQQQALSTPDSLGARIVSAVSSFVSAHARVCKAGVPTVAHDYHVIPVLPANTTQYVLNYPMTLLDAGAIEYYGDHCQICSTGWSEHVDGRCVGFLGETFSSGEVRYDELHSILRFDQQLQGWMEVQADTIYKLALEGAIT